MAVGFITKIKVSANLLDIIVVICMVLTPKKNAKKNVIAGDVPFFCLTIWGCHVKL